MSTQETVRIGFGAGSFRSTYEGAWCLNRPHESRPPLPRVGDVVLYRSNEFFEPISATVVAVDIEPGEPMTQIADPWPMLRLRAVKPLPAAKLDLSGSAFKGVAEMQPYYIETREARLEGSAGWLPLDHERYARPRAGQEA